MYSMLIALRDGVQVLEFTLKDEGRQELIRLFDDGKLTHYMYQQYLGFLLNGYDSVAIDGEIVFEITTPVGVEADEAEGLVENGN